MRFALVWSLASLAAGAVCAAGCDGVFGLTPFHAALDAAPDAPPDAPSSYSATVLADHPVAYLPFDEHAGALVAADLVPGGPTGTIRGVPVLEQDPPFAAANRAFRFDGNNGSVELGDVLAFTGASPYSVEVWVSPEAIVDTYYYEIASKWREKSAIVKPSGWNLYYALNQPADGPPDPPVFSFSREDDTGVGDAVNATSTPGWHHVVGTFDGTKLVLYVDGEYAAQHGSTRPIPVIDQALELGGGNGDPRAVPMDGSLDEVAIYDYALSDLQVRAHHDAASH